jgi:hypothetical protein
VMRHVVHARGVRVGADGRVQGRVCAREGREAAGAWRGGMCSGAEEGGRYREEKRGGGKKEGKRKGRERKGKRRERKKKRKKEKWKKEEEKGGRERKKKVSAPAIFTAATAAGRPRARNIRTLREGKNEVASALIAERRSRVVDRPPNGAGWDGDEIKECTVIERGPGRQLESGV